MPTIRALPGVGERTQIGLGLLTAITLTAVALVYHDTIAWLIAIWAGSGTFAHCFLIGPISAYLIWMRRDELRAAPKRTSVVGVLAVAALTAGWVVAALVRVQFAQQLAFVLLI